MSSEVKPFPLYLVFKTKHKKVIERGYITAAELDDFQSGRYEITVLYAGTCPLAASREYGNSTVVTGEGKMALDLSNIGGPKIMYATSGHFIKPADYGKAVTNAKLLRNRLQP